MTENASCYLFFITHREKAEAYFTVFVVASKHLNKALIDAMNRVRNKRSDYYSDIANNLNAQLQRVCSSVLLCSKYSHDVDLMTPMKTEDMIRYNFARTVLL